MKYYSITDADLIRYEVKASFQKIFQAQTNLQSKTNDIEHFLNSDDDTEPLQEINKRKLAPDAAKKMEGLLTIEELTNSLFNHMKGNSSPGIDGFTVNHLRTFWHELKHITCDALNCSFGGQLSTTLKKSSNQAIKKRHKRPNTCM